MSRTGKSGAGTKQADAQASAEQKMAEEAADIGEVAAGAGATGGAAGAEGVELEEAAVEAAHPDLTLEEALARLADAEDKCRRAEEKSLRLQAEMQNLRRRTEQDIERAHKFGQEKFSSELLVVMDNLERALNAASEHEDEAVKAIREGVNLTLKSLADCFARFDIETVDPAGEPFDPAIHQAMSIEENGEVEPNTVTAVMQKGYTLHGRVLRPAMVVVSAEPA